MPGARAAPDGSPLELITFVLLAMYPFCSRIDCQLAFWLQRAQKLAGALAHRAARNVGVDVFTRCRPEGVVRGEAGVAIRTHSGLPETLKRTQAFVSDEYAAASQRGPGLKVTLLKWVAVGLTTAEFACVLDMDMDVLPATLHGSLPSVADDWLAAMQTMRARGLGLAATHDHSAPVNSGFMLLRTSANVFADGLELLGRANTSFNVTHGWDLVGPPRDAIPASARLTTHVGLGMRHVLKRNLWDFVGADIDQGFFFHMYFVRHTGLGEYLANLAAPFGGTASKKGSGNVRAKVASTPSYCLVHFFTKPYRLPPRPPRCSIRLNKHWLAKAASYHRDVEATLGRHATDAIAPADVRATCAKRSNESLRCVRLKAELILAPDEVERIVNLPLSQAWSCSPLLPARRLVQHVT